MQPNQASPDILNALQSIALAIEANRAAPTNPYKFSAYRNAARNTSGGAYSLVPFDVEEFDTNSNYDPATGGYTAPVSGFYQFMFNIGLSVVSANNDNVAALYKNGSLYKWGSEQSTPSGAMGSILAQAAANDVFQVYIFTPNTVALNVGSAPQKTYFSGFLISTT